MTPAQAAWLRKLKDEGPQTCLHAPAGHAIDECHKAGWTARKGLGWKRQHITPAGLAALEAHEKTLPTDQG